MLKKGKDVDGMNDEIKEKIQKIANRNSGRAAQYFEMAGIENIPLKKNVQKLILHTADDILELLHGGEANEK